jgi:hypothetical protein
LTRAADVVSSQHQIGHTLPCNQLQSAGLRVSARSYRIR